MAAEAGTYDVFISYRSSRSPDREIAEQLQKTLERFPVPRSLRGALVRPARFMSRLRVFRDSSDLSATPDLWRAIRNELVRSRWLVVVCSPATPQSPWIAREIATFLELNDRERVISVLVEGEPDESIPAPLLSETIEVAQADGSKAPGTPPITPRACDLRAVDLQTAIALLAGWRTPRTRQKRFDVLAPILGLSSREDLVQRHRARAQRAFGAAAVGLLLIVLGGAYFQISTALAVARAEKADAERALAVVRAGEAVAQSEVTATKAREEVARSNERERLERENKIVETATRRLSQAYRYQYADPFTAAAEVYASTQLRALDDSEQVMNAIHDVLLERRATSIRERTIVRHGSFSFSAQSYEGERYTTLSRDGSKVLIITGRGGDSSTSESSGDVYVLDNGTTQMAPLNSCNAPDRREPSRLEFAAFLGHDKVIVARSLFHVDIYTVTGTCVGSFYLLKTKTPVTAAGGMLHDAFFIAGNGAGCVWIQDYRKPRFIEPSRELGAVANCDDKNAPNAVTQVLTNSRGDRGMLVFQRGRIDLFESVGPNDRPKRRTVVKQNGRAVAFERGGNGSTFAVSHGDRAAQKLELWDSARGKPARVRSFSLEGVDEPVDFLGFPSDGALLIGVDAACALHFWDREDGRHLLKRAARGTPCVQPAQQNSRRQ